MAQLGSFWFVMKPEDKDWVTNDKSYEWKMKYDKGELLATKSLPGELTITLRARDFTPRTITLELSPSKRKGTIIYLCWSDTVITLTLHGGSRLFVPWPSLAVSPPS